MEPPAGIEPATPSLPWNHREPLCEPPSSQVAPDRRGQSYRFSFGEVMRSLSSHALIVAEASRLMIMLPARSAIVYPAHFHLTVLATPMAIVIH